MTINFVIAEFLMLAHFLCSLSFEHNQLAGRVPHPWRVTPVPMMKSTPAAGGPGPSLLGTGETTNPNPPSFSDP
jgi:hypothetical protein